MILVVTPARKRYKDKEAPLRRRGKRFAGDSGGWLHRNLRAPLKLLPLLNTEYGPSNVMVTKELLVLITPHMLASPALLAPRMCCHGRAAP
jgi:hypothetical protein